MVIDSMSISIEKKWMKRSGIEDKWDWKRRTWFAPNGEKSLTEMWGGPPQKKRRVESWISSSAWTIDRVSNCANGKEMGEPWKREDVLCKTGKRWIF